MGAHIGVPQQSSTFRDPSGVIGYAYRAIDGKTDCTCTNTEAENAPWFLLDFGCEMTFNYVKLTGDAGSLNTFDLVASNNMPPCDYTPEQVCDSETTGFGGNKAYICDPPVKGRYLSLRAKDIGRARSLK